MRYLGFSGKILSVPTLATYDARPVNQRPHLSISLMYLRDVLEHLQRHAVFFYRLPHQFAPYLTHPERRWFHHQLEECADELEYLQQQIEAMHLRLSLHLPLSFDLCSAAEETQRQLTDAINKYALLLYALGGSHSVLVAHLGGQRASGRAGLERACRFIEGLAPLTRELLALEHDDCRWSLTDLLYVHEITAVPLVFDLFHHYLHDPTCIPVVQALQQALDTWPATRQPKIHLSSPRTELRISTAIDHAPRLHAPRWNEHSDYVHPFELIALLQLPTTRSYDVMLEAKAGDLALFRAREALARFAPQLQEVTP